jgi:hypothetical protein
MASLDALEPFVNELIFAFSVGAQREKDHFCFHLDYESEVYRQEELARLLRDSVEYFALTHEEFESFREDGDMVTARRLAWSRISTARKNVKGDYGELLLFLLLSFKMQDRIPRFVTKVRLRSSLGEQIKGFDCAHVTFQNNQLCLWLGEAKFHEKISTAISSAFESLSKHWDSKYLSKELKILGANCEANQGIDEVLGKELVLALTKGRSLDRLQFKVPILLTYDSDCVQQNKSVGDDFKKELAIELEAHFKSIEGKVSGVPSNFSLLFFLMPFKVVSEIKSALETMESALR